MKATGQERGSAGDRRVPGGSTLTVRLKADNGEPLTLTRWAPEHEARDTQAVVVAPAMATPAAYYSDFARWVASQGHIAYTFDYQGYGASATGPLSQVRADFLTWGSDAAAVLRYVSQEEPGRPVQWVGHSLGGQLLAFVDPVPLSRAVIVCSGTGYWRNGTGRDLWLAPVLWRIITPLTTRALGYYPGRRLRLLGDIPGPVMRQWAHWCMQPNYMLSVHPEFAERFAAVRIPVTSVSFTDDATMSEAATAHLEGWYSGAQLDRRRYVPGDLGTERIGHMAIFRPRHARLWPIVFDGIVAVQT